MKTCKYFFVLLVVLSLAMSSCEKGGDDLKTYGKFEYDGKSYALNDPTIVDITLPSATGFSTYKRVAFICPSNCMFILGFDIHEDFETDDITSCDGEFICGDIIYSSIDQRAYLDRWATPGSGSSNDDGTSHTGYIIVKSLGVNPKTGKEIVERHTMAYFKITAGNIKWDVNENTGKLEFNLIFEDGKTAKGRATIPLSVFETV